MTPTPLSVPAAEAALAAVDHVLGDPQAAVTLLEYGDYECPACVAAEAPLQRLLAQHGKRVCFVFRHFPWMELHPHAEQAAEAAEAAAAQGRFWPMHRQLFGKTHHLALPGLVACAEAVGLDMLRFKAEMADHIYTQRVQEHRRTGLKLGLKSTPAFFVNGRPVDVSAGFGRLEAAVDAAAGR